MTRLRSVLFNWFFYAWTAKSVILASLISLLPSRTLLDLYLGFWARGVRGAMFAIAGIRTEFRGLERLTSGTPLLIAAKHQSYCDGILMLSKLKGIAIVANKGLLKFPLLGRLLARLKMIMVENCGAGHGQTDGLKTGAREAARSGRAILIYPEGQLIPVGETGRYRSGIYHLYEDLQMPVVPVATNIGRCWPQNPPVKRPGRAVVEFLEPIAPGLSRADFMAELERRIETRTRELEAEAA